MQIQSKKPHLHLNYLGLEYESEMPSDRALAKYVNNIDVILGGHTHTLLEKPLSFSNPAGAEVLVNQVGWAGTHVGLIEIIFEKKARKKRLQSHTVIS